jgi:pilus assembly protein CpaB
MKYRLPASWTMLVGAVVFGGLAVFSASRYISQTVQREKDRLIPNVETTDVVVAKADLKRGDIVGADNMAVRKVPKEFVPGTAVDPAGFGNVEGARLAVEMRRGEVLIRGTLEGADTSTFSTRVQTGVRAITLTVDEVNSLAGLLQPSDRVDLFFTAKPIKGSRIASPGGPDQTRLLMQNVIILATGRQVRPTIANGAQTGVGRAFTTITIEASPTDVERLILAQKAGNLTAVLRGNTDAQPIVASAMDASELFGVSGPHGRHAPAPVTTEVIIGGKGGGHAERELLQALGLDRAAPVGAATSQTAPAPAATDSATALRDYLKSTAVPAEAATMTR